MKQSVPSTEIHQTTLHKAISEEVRYQVSVWAISIGSFKHLITYNTEENEGVINESVIIYA